jgi:parvulin-like peptidyl-prolyl isomerase
MRASLCLLLCISTIASAQNPPLPEKPTQAATVNGTVILLAEVDAILKKFPTTSGPLSDSQAQKLRKEVLQDLVDDVLLKQYMKQHGPKVESAEVDQLMKGLAENLKKQGKSLESYFREGTVTEAQAREQWTTMLQLQKWSDAKATEEELKKYYTTYKDFFDRTTVKTHHIVLRISPTAISGERAAAKVKLNEIRAEILAGKITFADAARKHSIDPTSVKGGEIGFIARRDTIVDETIARIAFALPVQGLSEPIDSDYGVHLVHVTERKVGKSSTYMDALDAVKDCYTEDVRQLLVAELRKTATISIHLP